MFSNLRELILSMPTEEQCREYIAQQRWEGGKAGCPYCGHDKCYKIEKGFALPVFRLYVTGRGLYFI